MDVGVGVKGYAVIEQGKIGQILSSKPTDRRQLIEEAAGVTKFKSRRRQAELKLEAAQQNLTRVDDLVYELERQRAALKRQAGEGAALPAAARGAAPLGEAALRAALRAAARGDPRRRARGSPRRASASRLAAARLAEVESDLERVRIELAEADAPGQRARAEAHQRELENERRQQQITFDQQQAAALVQTVQEIAAELGLLEARRGPAREEIETRRDGRAGAPTASATPPARRCATRRAPSRRSRREIGTLDRDVDAARRGATVNLQSTTTLQHTIERAEEGRQRIGGELGRLDVEAQDLRIEVERLRAERVQAQEALRGGAGGARRHGHRAAGGRLGPRHRADRARLARARRAHARRRPWPRPKRACDRCRSSRRRAPPTAKRRAWCSARPRPASPTTDRSPTTSRSIPAASVPSKRRSATCCSASSSTRRPTPIAGWPSCASAAPAAAASCRPAATCSSRVSRVRRRTARRRSTPSSASSARTRR